jgi:hypothetical protein
MRALILKEWREHLKWVPLPGLVILLVFAIEEPEEPMPWSSAAYYYCLTAVVFAAALGFLQIIFEAHGDRRSLLLHRPLYPSRIFLAKALAGVSLYLLALGIPWSTTSRGCSWPSARRAGTAAGVWPWPEPSSAPAWSGHCPSSGKRS